MHDELGTKQFYLTPGSSVQLPAANRQAQTCSSIPAKP